MINNYLWRKSRENEAGSGRGNEKKSCLIEKKKQEAEKKKNKRRKKKKTIPAGRNFQFSPFRETQNIGDMRALRPTFALVS